MSTRFQAFCIDSDSPCSSESKATLSTNRVRYLASCSANVVLPLPDLPKISHDPFNSGRPSAALKGPSNGAGANFASATFLLLIALLIRTPFNHCLKAVFSLHAHAA